MFEAEVHYTFKIGSNFHLNVEIQIHCWFYVAVIKEELPSISN